jgi:hypothetical protein
MEIQRNSIRKFKYVKMIHSQLNESKIELSMSDTMVLSVCLIHKQV